MGNTFRIEGGKKMKEYIKPVSRVYGAIGSYVNEFELLGKVNEIIEYLNGVISVGLLPIPEGYKEEGTNEEEN